ncbi:MAG: LuxR C-terminal-related transcriptional regulator [Pseudomonadota bacterium]
MTGRNSPDARSLIDRFAGRFPVHAMRRMRLPDGTFRYAHVSPAVAESFGLDVDALLAMKRVDHHWIDPRDRQHFITALNASADDLTPLDEEVRVLAPDGRVRWVRSLGDPEYLADGTVVWDGVALDVTDRREALQRVVDAMESARAAEVAASAGASLPRDTLEHLAAALWPSAGPPDVEGARAAASVLLAAVGVRPAAQRRDAAPSEAKLTARQREIGSLVAKGLPNREIAELLGLMEGTVKLHVSRILRRLSLRNRTELTYHLGAFAGRPAR